MKKGKNVVIEDGCRISDSVILGDDVYIESGVIIYDNVRIGSNSFIGADCILGEHLAGYYRDRASYVQPELIIGANSLIRSKTIIYAGTKIGENFQTGHRVTIRENTNIGNFTRIGTNCDIQDGVEIGNYVNIHSDVFISADNKICDYVWICPRVLFANDYTPPSNEIKGSVVESFCTVGANATILPGSHIKSNVLVAAGAVLGGNTESGWAYAGVPAKKMKLASQINNHVTGEKAYPWPMHFKRGMPWEEKGFEEWRNQ